MISKMFAIYDSKAEYYLPSLTFTTTGESLRNFADAVNDPQTMLHRHSSDFTLFEIGTYDNSNGQITMLQASVNLGCAIEFLIDQHSQQQPVEHHPTNGA